MSQRSWSEVFIQRWAVVALAVAVTAVVSVAFGMTRSERHEVVTRFFVQSQLPGLAGSPFEPTAGEDGWNAVYAPITSRAVVTSAVEAAGIPSDSVDMLIEDDLLVVANEQAHTVTVSAIVEGDGEQALTFMDSLVAATEEAAVGMFDRSLEARLDVSRELLESTWDRVRVYDLPDGYTEPVYGGTDAYDALSREVAQLEVALAAEKEVLVTLDPPIADKVSPAPLKNGAIGIALGLVAGLGIALVQDAADQRKAAVVA